MSPDTWILVSVLLLAAAALIFRRKIIEQIDALREQYAPRDTEEMDLAAGAGGDMPPDPEFMRLLGRNGPGGQTGSGRTAGTEGTEMDNGTGARKRFHIVFWGKVQGVGFRYQAMYAAEARRLTGWILNREDGAVEMEVQGPEEEIGRMISHMRQARWIRILSMDVNEVPLKENERSFRVLGY